MLRRVSVAQPPTEDAPECQIGRQLVNAPITLSSMQSDVSDSITPILAGEPSPIVKAAAANSSSSVQSDESDSTTPILSGEASQIDEPSAACGRKQKNRRAAAINRKIYAEIVDETDQPKKIDAEAVARFLISHNLVQSRGAGSYADLFEHFGCVKSVDKTEIKLLICQIREVWSGKRCSANNKRLKGLIVMPDL